MQANLDMLIADVSLAEPPRFYRLLGIVLIATAALIVLHLLLTGLRSAQRGTRPAWSVWQRLVYLGTVLSVAVLGITAFYAVLRIKFWTAGCCFSTCSARCLHGPAAAVGVGLVPAAPVRHLGHEAQPDRAVVLLLAAEDCVLGDAGRRNPRHGLDAAEHAATVWHRPTPHTAQRAPLQRAGRRGRPAAAPVRRRAATFAIAVSRRSTEQPCSHHPRRVTRNDLATRS